MKLSIQNLGISFDGQKILEDFSLSVAEHEFVSIIGPSGCGKSTLLNILAGMLQSEVGSIYVDDKPLAETKKHFAYMPQEDLLFEHMTLLDNITLFGKLHHIDQSVNAMTLLKQFKLESKANAYPHELSGGMRQRGAFLRTMLADAEILLLDEPFGALDVLTRNEIQDFLLELKQSWNKTALMVTHDLDEALYLSDRIIVLNGNPASVCANISLPKEKRTREWLYSQNELRMKLHELLKHA